MDPVTLIVTALVAGAGTGLTGAVSSAVADAYDGLKALVCRKLAGREVGTLVLAQHEQDPQVWEKPLVQELTAAGASNDQELVSAAQALMQLVDAAGSAAGKYIVVTASDHSAAAGRDMNFTGSGGAVVAAAIHGNVTPGPTPPGPAQG